LGTDLPWLEKVESAKRPRRLPAVQEPLGHNDVSTTMICTC